MTEFFFITVRSGKDGCLKLSSDSAIQYADSPPVNLHQDQLYNTLSQSNLRALGELVLPVTLLM